MTTERTLKNLDFPIKKSRLIMRFGSDRQRNRIRLRRRLGIVGTVLVLVATTAITVVAWPYVVCGSGLQRVEGECVGVNDGSASFHPDLDWLTNRIERMNNEVAERSATVEGVSAVRIALMTSFSLDGDADLGQRQIIRAVEGTYAAFMRENDFKENDLGSSISVESNRARLFQLYLANEGSTQQGADIVVQDLEGMIDDDIPLTAVIGQSSTTAVTERVARELSQRNIPMIAGSSTSTTINNENSPGLIRAAPNNEDYAVAIRDYLDGQQADRDDLSDGMLVSDENEADIFSLDLRDQLHTYLEPYLVHHEKTFEGNAGSGNREVYFDSIVNEICSADPDMIFFAGRFSDLENFLESLERRNCTRSDQLREITVFSVEIGLHPGVIDDYAASDCTADDEDSSGSQVNLIQASAFDPAWLNAESWRPAGFSRFHAAMTEIVQGEERSANTDSDFYNGYALIYHDAAVAAIAATKRGLEAADRDTVAESTRGQLFRVSELLTGSGHLDYFEELEGRVTGRHVPIVSFPCIAETENGTPFQIPDQPYPELYDDIED
ncbi:ABC transporter substrate-binding protein [Haloglycomyces albus]|uniref:ABC transporter substrate-binding protein n=1 Tax=Haloglycomyces albus TaxID=526067 RepID=UPI00046D4E84|nr:ABC transporter substrate-binding protein [Haloglycomyces albus]